MSNYSHLRSHPALVPVPARFCPTTSLGPLPAYSHLRQPFPPLITSPGRPAPSLNRFRILQVATTCMVSVSRRKKNH